MEIHLKKFSFATTSVVKKSTVAILCMCVIGLCLSIVSCDKPIIPTDPIVNGNDTVGNEEDPNDSIYPLNGTSWKLEGIFDTQTEILKVLEPIDCEKCYMLTFNTDSTATGTSAGNIVWVDFSANRSANKDCIIGIATMKGEIGDGLLFWEAVALVTTIYSYDGKNLKFFYTKNESEYYLKYFKID